MPLKNCCNFTVKIILNQTYGTSSRYSKFETKLVIINDFQTNVFGNFNHQII